MWVTLPLCLVPSQCTLLRPCYGSSLAFAGLPHTNEHLCDHVFITILLTSVLLSPRPGWNRRWCYHCSVPKPSCDNRHSIVSTLTVQSDINPRTTVASIKVFFRGIKASIHTRFALTPPFSRHFALSDVLYRHRIQQFANFLAWRYCKNCIYTPIPLWNFFQFLAA